MRTNILYKVLKKILLFSGCMAFLLAGCDKSSDEKPEDKQVVSKKIVMQKKNDSKEKAETQKPMAEAGGPSAGPPAQKSDAAKQTAPDRRKKSEKIEESSSGTASGMKVSEEKAVPVIAIGRNVSVLAYEYNPAGKIDPFETIFKEEPEPEIPVTTKNEENKRIPTTPLEKISLSQLKLAAVMLAPSGDKALVEEASGKGYVITQGTYIGKNSGRVVDILMDRIIIEEVTRDLFGKAIQKRIEMMLQKRPGE